MNCILCKELSRFYNSAVLRYNRLVAMPIARRKFKSLEIFDSFQSIQYIIDNKCSVSRFGDGEFDIVRGGCVGFQKTDRELANSLTHVLQATDAPNHIVGIPYYLKNTSGCVTLTKDFWGFFVMHYGNIVYPLLSRKRKYIDTQLSRFWIEWQDKKRCYRQLEMLKQIWENQDVIIVEGTESRTGVGNDLYDNTNSIKRILGPAKNAYSSYNKIFKKITEYADKRNLILLSLGPTATILAYELAKLGYWAIDIGHIDIEYEWMKLGAADPIPIHGKFTNEAQTLGGHDVDFCNDAEYHKQIVCDITQKCV